MNPAPHPYLTETTTSHRKYPSDSAMKNCDSSEYPSRGSSNNDCGGLRTMGRHPADTVTAGNSHRISTNPPFTSLHTPVGVAHRGLDRLYVYPSPVAACHRVCCRVSLQPDDSQPDWRPAQLRIQQRKRVPRSANRRVVIPYGPLGGGTLEPTNYAPGVFAEPILAQGLP